MTNKKNVHQLLQTVVMTTNTPTCFNPLLLQLPLNTSNDLYFCVLIAYCTAAGVEEWVYVVIPYWLHYQYIVAVSAILCCDLWYTSFHLVSKTYIECDGSHY